MVEWEDACSLLADTWWMVLSNGRVQQQERKLLQSQRRKLGLEDDIVDEVVRSLNLRFREARAGMFIGFTFVGVWLKDRICWDFQVYRCDLEALERGFKTEEVSPGYFAAVVTWLWQLLSRKTTDGQQYRFQLLLEVLRRVVTKFTRGQQPEAWEALQAWFEAAATTYLTIGSLYVGDVVRACRYALDVVIVVNIWRSLGRWWPVCAWLVLWLASAYIKRVIDTWQEAMKPRLPFLSIRLQAKYRKWLDEYGPEQ